jgi:predicted ester cyclase
MNKGAFHMSSVEDIRALVYRVYETINSRDRAARHELFTPDFVSHALENTKETGETMLNRLFATFPDTRFVVEDVVVEGNKAALRVAIHGTTQQPLPIIMEIFRIENGRVAEVWGAGTIHLPLTF